MTKRTYQPKKVKTLRKRGYRARASTPGGRNVLKRRRTKGRKKLTVSDRYRLIKKTPKSRNK
ncbi:50S ribosomal protein L34 [Candidatus Dojkabacteria bacterium]|nr:50S ribosomal protein L34 [Candidatus Dojkabacteria bacterium]